MNHVDLKYSGILSTRVQGFKLKSHSPYRANLRCPICGDSQKSKHKARGWILEKDNSGIYYCHNCGASMGLRNLLKTIDTNLYNDYVVDMALDKGYKKKEEPKPKPLDTLRLKRPNFAKKGSPLLKIMKMSQLSVEHPVRHYINNRKIPTNQHYKIYFAKHFNKWVNSLVPNKLNEKFVEPRIVLPFIDKKNVVFGFQGRSLNNDGIRYITIMLDEDMPKIFGLNTVDYSKLYYVVEGPIDSLFLSNAVAMAGADGNARGLDNVENAIFVFDNEPRNKEIVARMEKCLDKGYKVCIWPKNILDKDINDVILSGIKGENLQLIIDQNSYSGLQGKLQLSEWRKV